MRNCILALFLCAAVACVMMNSYPPDWRFKHSNTLSNYIAHKGCGMYPFQTSCPGVLTQDDVNCMDDVLPFWDNVDSWNADKLSYLERMIKEWGVRRIVWNTWFDVCTTVKHVLTFLSSNTLILHYILSFVVSSGMLLMGWIIIINKLATLRNEHKREQETLRAEIAARDTIIAERVSEYETCINKLIGARETLAAHMILNELYGGWVWNIEKHLATLSVPQRKGALVKLRIYILSISSDSLKVILRRISPFGGHGNERRNSDFGVLADGNERLQLVSQLYERLPNLLPAREVFFQESTVA